MNSLFRCFFRFQVVIRTKFYATCLSKELLAMKTGSIRNFLPGKTLKNDTREEHVPWITEQNVQLEILTPTDSEALGKRYFVPNGDRGEKWLQYYFQGCDTGGILVQSEIKEREGKVEPIEFFAIHTKLTMLSTLALKVF